MCANQVPPLVPHVILWLRLQWPVLDRLEASSGSGHFAGLSRHFAWFQKPALDSSLLFPIRVQVSLFSVLRSLSLFADSVLPAFGRRFNLSRSALPHRYALSCGLTTNSPMASSLSRRASCLDSWWQFCGFVCHSCHEHVPGPRLRDCCLFPLLRCMGLYFEWPDVLLTLVAGLRDYGLVCALSQRRPFHP